MGGYSFGGGLMPNARTVALSVIALASVSWFRASGQSVVSTHSGVIYFFVGSVFLGNERLEQKFGRFLDIGEGQELRTELGRAEVLLTPGVFLRLDANSSIRMLATQFSDTRFELLAGSAILEATEATPGTSVSLLYKNWQVRVPQEGTYRIDTAPPLIRPYKGQVEVGIAGKAETVGVREGEILPLAEVLVPEPSTTYGNDDFKLWAMSRSQAIAADNTIAAGIVDAPPQTDGPDFASGGYTYFPPSGMPFPDMGVPYGVSFWTPYQSALSSIYFPPYLMYRPVYGGWPIGRWPGGGSTIGLRPYPGRAGLPVPIGLRPPHTIPPRMPAPVPRPAPTASPSPHVAIGGVHPIGGGHR